jgi:Carboxylesterase family
LKGGVVVILPGILAKQARADIQVPNRGGVCGGVVGLACRGDVQPGQGSAFGPIVDQCGAQVQMVDNLEELAVVDCRTAGCKLHASDAQVHALTRVFCQGAVHRLVDPIVGLALGNALCPGASDVIACLRDKNADELAAWGKDLGISGPGWAPSYDPNDPLMPAKPAQLIAQGNFQRGAMIVGTNKSEWGLFQAGTGPIQSATQFAAAVDAQFGPIAPLVKAHYAVTSDDEANTVFIRLMTDVMFRCPTRTLARATAAHGSTVYLYSFEEGIAFHAFELSYIFGPQFNFEPSYVASTLTTM